VGYDYLMDIVVSWNGEDVPVELRDLPKGRYVLVPIDDATELSAEHEAGLEAALASIRAGRGVSLGDAKVRLKSRLGR